MRLLVVTARYPTRDRPAAGTFVRNRLVGADARVIAPDRYDQPGWRRYLRLARLALTVRGRFDGVEGHFLLPSGPLALLAARLRRLPLVVYVHGGDIRDQAERHVPYRLLARLVLQRAEAVATNSRDTAARIAAFGREAEVIFPGVDLSRLQPRPRPAQRRVLYLGGAEPRKGYEVARDLADTLVGPGLREVDPEEVPRLLAEHDVVLVPSHHEPFGLVAAEAIAAGRWVVARAVDGLREVVADGVNGTLVADGDFKAALARVPDYDPHAVARTATQFGLERHRAEMEGLWRRVLASRARAP